MRCLSSQFSGHRSVESDSHKTYEFSAPESYVEKRMRILDEPSGRSHQTVDFSESEKRYDLTTLPAGRCGCETKKPRQTNGPGGA
jgi:hypothetical protein